MRDLYVVTHGEAEHHVTGLVGGWHDSVLTSRGQEQAAAAARSVTGRAPAGTRVVSSDLRRAAQTARPIADALGSAVELRPELRELSYGEAEGRPQAWLDARFVPAPDHARLDHRYGIPGSESKRELADRVYRVVAELLDQPWAHLVVVTHGFALTFVVAAWARLPLESVGWLNLHAPAGSITHLREDDRFGNRAVVSLARVPA